MSANCKRGCTENRKCSIHDGYEYPFPVTISKRLNGCLAFGNTAIIEIIPPGEYIKKSPHPQVCTSEKARQVRQLMREVQIYKRLPPHPRLLSMIQYSDNELDGYIMFKYMRNGDLQSHLASSADIQHGQQLVWCIQAAEGVAFLHSFGIIHADIKPQNILLDNDMALRIIDMSGSSIDGLPPLCLESTRFFLPRPIDSQMRCSVNTDLFALGSTLYQIMRRQQPYADLDDDEVTHHYQNHIFPSITDLPCGDIILKCWTGRFTSAETVVCALKSQLPHQEA